MFLPRRGYSGKREIPADPLYGNRVFTKMINKVMWDGKRSIAERLCYDAMTIVKEKTRREPLEVFEQAMKNIMPVLEVKARRVGGANYQVPIEVRTDRRMTLGIRWLVGFARDRSGKSMEEKLAAEIMDAANGTGSSVKKREDTHKRAEANKAFAHYRW
jgi:small subunit ribosomal protein S7